MPRSSARRRTPPCSRMRSTTFTSQVSLRQLHLQQRHGGAPALHRHHVARAHQRHGRQIFFSAMGADAAAISAAAPSLFKQPAAGATLPVCDVQEGPGAAGGGHKVETELKNVGSSFVGGIGRAVLKIQT